MTVLAQALLTFFLNACWQVALVAGFAMLCDWLLRGMAARARHVLWVSNKRTIKYVWVNAIDGSILKTE